MKRMASWNQAMGSLSRASSTAWRACQGPHGPATRTTRSCSAQDASASTPDGGSGSPEGRSGSGLGRQSENWVNIFPWVDSQA